jgi:hypothetical protein
MEPTTFFVILVAAPGVAALILATLSKPLSRWMHGKG